MQSAVLNVRSSAGRRKCTRPGLLLLVVLVASGPVLATPGSGASVAESAAVADAPKRINVTDPGWRPPVAADVVLPAMLEPARAEEIARQWGVQLLSLRLSAGDYMMDFRFRVLDADKAAVFFDQRIKPYVLVERSSAKLPVPMATKVGALRPTNRGKNIRANRNYYMMFANPDRHVQRGGKATLVIGDFRVEHLTVN